MKVVHWSLLALAVPGLLRAQAEATERGAATITEADVRRRIGIIADDSMGGRDTPSRGLDLTARWVADEFKRFGLKPAGDSGGYLQRYPINVASTDPDSMFIELSSAGRTIKLQLEEDVALATNGRPPTVATAVAVTLVGPMADSSLRADVGGRLALWIGDWSKGVPENIQPVLATLQRAGALGVLAIVNNDSIAAEFAGTRTSAIVRPGPPLPNAVRPTGSFFIGLVAESKITAAIPEAAEAFARLRAAPGVARVAAGWSASMVARIKPAEAAWLPNTVGILEGSDPVLKNEYVVLSGHMDHVGRRCRGATPADTICNGADDDASGTVGVVELAEAFSAPGARPRRSLIFVTVSAEERGLWGSQYFANHLPVEPKSVVADLNMDMIGRNWKDTVVAIGMQHSDLGATAERVAAAHPELRMKVIDDQWPQENLYGRSDHYNFAVKGIPILFFTSGLHDDYHAVTDSPDKIDAEKEARILQLVYYLAAEVGNRTARPVWNPESYRKIVSGR